MKKKITLILLILALSIYTLNINVQITAEENNYKPTSLELTPHYPIEITSDSDFEVFPGTGTEEDPCIIEGYSITATSMYGIYISATTKYFVVRHCYVDASYYGIYIDNVADDTATVINNTCNNNNFGIWLEDSRSSKVANNTCSNNNNRGIYLRSSNSSTVIYNTCNNNGDDGIRLVDSGSATIVNNTFTNCGLYINEDTIDAYLSNIVENNWVNGKKLGFYTNLDSMTIDEPVYGQLILVNCTNVIVRNQIINNATTGLFLYFCKYSVIINNMCSNNNNVGIRMDFSDNSTVTNNTCSNNGYGIYLFGSDSSIVANNTCSYNNDYGIYLPFSGSSTVANNTCNNNGYGIKFWYSDNSTVTNNTCNNNRQGIILWDSGSVVVANNTCNNNEIGIHLHRTAFCVVTYNLLQENEGYGVYLSQISWGNIEYNSLILQENEGYGVYSLYGHDNNLIHHNTFVDNNLGGSYGGTSQGYEDGQNNYWYDTETLEGNYWSDWSGRGSYVIDGPAGSEDLYPFDEPVEYSTDENPLNFTFTLLMLVFTLILTRIISKKAKKKNIWCGT